MSYTLATVLVSLTLPAIALAIIFGMERRGQKTQDESGLGMPDPAVAPEFRISSAGEAIAQATVENPPYRERAG